VVELPLPPQPAVLRAVGAELHRCARSTTLWRLHDTVGDHVLPWDALRTYGPIERCRFDPHDPPPRQQTAGVCYLALDLPTALAEFFQDTRVINTRRSAPHLTAFQPRRGLRLLDLTGEWPVRAGASHVINTGRRDITRAWARAITAAWPELDGLWHTSSMTGRPCVTIFNPAADAVPAAPAFSEPLDHPGLRLWVAAASDLIGYGLL